jgi:hypothetical protein
MRKAVSKNNLINNQMDIYNPVVPPETKEMAVPKCFLGHKFFFFFKKYVIGKINVRFKLEI